ncbi:MAG: heparinase II/III family protein [Clostridium sp.]
MDKNIVSSKIRIKRYIEEEYGLDSMIKYLIENCSDEYRKKKIVANLLMKNIFLFDDTWDMEGCHIPYGNEDLNWSLMPNGDEEWAFMLNRQEYLYKLLLVYYIEDKEEYIYKLKELIFRWIEDNDLNDENIVPKRAIDTGIRINSWIEILKHLVNKELISDLELEKVLSSIKDQIHYLRRIYKEKYVLSNWGILQTVAIINSYIWFGEYLGNIEILEWAIEQFNDQVDIQIFNDGSHWEQSPMYHVEVLKCIHNYVYNMKSGKNKVEKKFIEVIEKMTDFMLYAMSPTGEIEAQCDSDRTAVKDILEKGYILTGNKKYIRNLDDKVTLSTIYMMGKESMRGRETNIEEAIEDSKSYIDSGNIYIRNSWESEADFTIVKNGTLGSGHGHCDLGHISLYSDGNPFLIDGGRYTYEETDKVREYLKSAYAHNGCIIDGLPAGIPLGSWDYEYYSDCMKNYYYQKEGVHYVEIAYVSKIDNKIGIITRKIIYINEGIWMIVTDVKSKGSHIVNKIYNLDSNVILNGKDGKSFIARNNSELVMCFEDAEKIKIKDSIISKKYNQINNNKKISLENRFKDSLVTKDIFHKKNILKARNEDLQIRICDSKNNLDKEKYIIEKFYISEQESYTVIIFNNETYTGRKLKYYEKTPIYGKVMVIHESEKEIKKIVLRS